MNRASIDLVLASFDLLVLQANRGDSEDHTFATRSFIVNKLPLLLLSASSTGIVQLNMPLVLQQALGRGANTVPECTAFLAACSLHSLITDVDKEHITGIGVSAPQAGTPAHHASLLQQYKANPQAIEKFIASLELLDGNAAAVAETIVNVRTASSYSIPLADMIPNQDNTNPLLRKAHYAAQGYMSQPCLQPASSGRHSSDGWRGSLSQPCLPAPGCLATGCRSQ